MLSLHPLSAKKTGSASAYEFYDKTYINDTVVVQGSSPVCSAFRLKSARNRQYLQGYMISGPGKTLNDILTMKSLILAQDER